MIKLSRCFDLLDSHPRALRASRTAQVKDAGRTAKRGHFLVRERDGRPRTPICVVLGVSLAFALSLAAAPSAYADFGIEPGSLHVEAVNADGTPDLIAGSHPYAVQIEFNMNHDSEGNAEGSARDIVALLPAGLVGDPTAVPTCSRAKFDGQLADCPPESQLGVLGAAFRGKNETQTASQPSGVYNLAPPPGVAASIGYGGSSFHAILNASIARGGPGGYRVATTTNNITLPHLASTEATVWGEPADPGHDADRECVSADGTHTTPCTTSALRKPYLTLPSSCTGPLESTFEADSVEEPGIFRSENAFSLNSAGEPEGLLNCAVVPFTPTIAASPTSKLASNPSGLDFELSLPNFGLQSPGGIAEAEPRKAVVTLPEGVTLNASEAEGLGVCSEAQIDLEGEAEPSCPEASKLGSVEVHTPLLQEPLTGSLYLAKPYENKFDSLIAIYMVFKNKERGVLVKLAGKVEPDPQTGQLVTTFEDLPQLPFSDFKLHFREGGRAPLITPPLCGTYDVEAKFYPWSDPSRAVEAKSPFNIEHGVTGGACPPGGQAPFHPGFEAGSLNNFAGSYSPFVLRLTRGDGEQDITKFSTTLPPGMVGKLAGVAKCPQADVEAAKHLTGTQEQQNPSCPASSQIGNTLSGAGVGNTLVTVPGKLYLGGAYHGDPLSVIAIVPAVAGPFDVGDVVVQEALTLNPVTAEVEVDGSHSDPIPHSLAGIPLNVRYIRVSTDRPSFTLNPTSCARFSTRATLWAGGTSLHPTSESPFALASPFQAADCASLGFKPRLRIDLKGGTKRGKFPALTATVAPRAGDANFSSAVVTLPHSAFLEQGHFGTICTRVQFAAGAGDGAGCPAASIYGHARAITPLLDEPLEGPVYLRSSNHNLPDLVVVLHGIVNVVLDARIDSFHGGIRTHFEGIPDAPVTSFTLQMEGGKKGLVVNSTNLCAKPASHRAEADLAGQNGRLDQIKPAVRALKCKRAKRHTKKLAGHRRG